MDLMFVEDTIISEEKENLKNNIKKFEKIIKDKKNLKNKYENEKDNYKNDYENIRYFQLCNNQISKLIKEIRELEETEENPYFGRLIFETKDNDIDLYVGNKSIRDDKNNNIVYDWRAPVASMYYSNQTNLEYKGYSYKLKLKRNLIIDKKELLNCEESYNIEAKDNFINDNFLRLLIRNKKNQDGFTDIIKTIQYKQNDIIRADLNSNIICQGSAGSGKTAIILHRISYLLFNNPNILAEKFLFITPNDNFKKELNELNKKLEIDKITLKTLNEYYLDKLNEYINMDETQQIKLNKVIGDIEEKDSFEEKDILNNFEKIKRIYIEHIKEFEKLYNIEYDNNLLPVENGKKVYRHILNIIKNVDNEKNNVKNTYKTLKRYLENFHLTTVVKMEIPKNYIQVFNEKMNNKINEKNNFVESLKKENINKQDIENNIRQIDIKIEKNVMAIKSLKRIIDSYNISIIKLVQKKKIEKLKEKLEQIITENSLLTENRNLAFEKLKEIQQIDMKINEIKKMIEIKEFGNIIFEFLDIIKKNRNYYGINDEDFFEFKNHYNRLIKQLLIDETSILFKDEILSNIKKIMNSIELIDIEESKNHKETVRKLYKEINPLNVIKLTFKEVLNKDFSENMSLTRYEAFLILKILNMFNFNKSINYNYIYLDEAQDYNNLEIKLVKELEEGYLNIFGDINQNVKGKWFQRNDWKSLEKCLEEDIKYYELNENYRNTTNVVDYCNRNLKIQMNGVGIEGNDVKIKKYTELSEIIEEAQKNNSVIITDNIEYLQEIRLQKKLRCFSIKETKGLEFQNIIVIDEDMNENSKYIAYTRTLNDLIIYRKD